MNSACSLAAMGLKAATQLRFFRLGDVVATYEDVSKGMREGETQKVFPHGVSRDLPSYVTHVLFCYAMAFPIEKASPIYSPAL